MSLTWPKSPPQFSPSLKSSEWMQVTLLTLCSSSFLALLAPGGFERWTRNLGSSLPRASGSQHCPSERFSDSLWLIASCLTCFCLFNPGASPASPLVCSWWEKLAAAFWLDVLLFLEAPCGRLLPVGTRTEARLPSDPSLDTPSTVVPQYPRGIGSRTLLLPKQIRRCSYLWEGVVLACNLCRSSRTLCHLQVMPDSMSTLCRVACAGHLQVLLCGTLQLKKFISICCWLNLPVEPIDSEVNCIHFSRLFRKTKPLGTPVVAKVPWPFLFLVRRLQHLSLPGHPLSELPACLLSSQTLLWERTPANPVPIAVSSPRPFTQDCPPLKCCTWLFSPFSHLRPDI